jgi:phenylacetate-CoA ligase
LICTPTYALHLAEVASEEGIDIAQSSIRITIHAGEPGASLPATKKRIEEAWGAKCFDHAGATEVGAWGFQCDGYSGLYINEGEFIFEVIDPDTGQQAEEGELVISNLGRIGMPVIRYRTGDHVKLDTKPYDGGVKFRRLSGGVIGRVDDVLIVRGINIYPSAVENIVRQFPQVGEFAVDLFRRHQMDDMEIRLEINQDADTAETVVKVSNAVRNGLGLRVNIQPVPVGTLPRFDLKARRFNDHRNTNMA